MLCLSLLKHLGGICICDVEMYTLARCVKFTSEQGLISVRSGPTQLNSNPPGRNELFGCGKNNCKDNRAYAF